MPSVLTKILPVPGRPKSVWVVGEDIEIRNAYFFLYACTASVPLYTQLNEYACRIT